MTIDKTNYKDILSQLYINDVPLYKVCENIVFSVNDSTFNYVPQPTYLSNAGIGANSIIFKALDLNKIDFCTDAYGHAPLPLDCDFPEPAKDFDKALIRVTKALFDECLKNERPIKQIELLDTNIKLFLDVLEDKKSFSKSLFDSLDDLES